MRVAVYARKSRYSDAGESIENQISMCKDYANIHYDNSCVFYEYRDEGFSGSNINRPAFKELIANIKNFDVLICYRLDRISRNVSDFSIFLKVLEKNDVSFISIKECFDTSTPMGRAMIHIASVFSQLERETIAERIKDNKYKLARLGTWQGGIVPLGYKTKRITYMDNKKKRAYYILVPDENTKPIIETIYALYIKYRSYAEVSRQLENRGIPAPKGGAFARSTLRSILTNPVYSDNSKIAYDFLNTLGVDIATAKECFDGKGGLIAYLKTSSHAGYNSFDKWIIACRESPGLVTGKTWVKVNKAILKNTKTTHSKDAMLSSLIYCKECDFKMYVRGNRTNKNGDTVFYYRCPKCKLSYNGTILDDEIWSVIYEKLLKDTPPSYFGEYIEKEKALANYEAYAPKMQELLYKILFDFHSLDREMRRNIYFSIIGKVSCSVDKIEVYLRE